MTDKWIPRSLRLLAAAGLVLAVAGSLAGCGRKGGLEYPEGAEPNRTYPIEEMPKPVEAQPLPGLVVPAPPPASGDDYMLNYPNQ